MCSDLYLFIPNNHGLLTDTSYQYKSYQCCQFWHQRCFQLGKMLPVVGLDPMIICSRVRGGEPGRMQV